MYSELLRDDNLARKPYSWIPYPNEVGITQCNKIRGNVRVQFSIPEPSMSRVQILVYLILVPDPTTPDYTYNIFKYIFMFKYNMNI